MRQEGITIGCKIANSISLALSSHNTKLIEIATIHGNLFFLLQALKVNTSQTENGQTDRLIKVKKRKKTNRFFYVESNFTVDKTERFTFPVEASGFIALKSNELLKFGIKCECNNCTKLSPFVVCSALFCFANYCFVSSNANSHGSKTHIKERFSSADDFKLFCLSPIFCPSWLGACVLSTYHNALEHQSKRNRRKKRSTKKRQHKDILKKEQPLENEK